MEVFGYKILFFFDLLRRSRMACQTHGFTFHEDYFYFKSFLENIAGITVYLQKRVFQQVKTCQALLLTIISHVSQITTLFTHTHTHTHTHTQM